MALSDLKIRTAKPIQKAYKLSDERGLFLLIHPNGGKYWRYKYRFNGKEKLLSLGVYPDVSLGDARSKRDEARRMLANNLDPNFIRNSTKEAAKIAAQNTFELVTREWHQKFSTTWSSKYKKKVLARFETHVFPWIGDRPVFEIKATDLLNILQRVEKNVETAHRIRSDISKVFRYAKSKKLLDNDPSADLRGVLPPIVHQHHPSLIDPEKVGTLLYLIDGYRGYIVTQMALKLAPLLFVRIGELRHAEWNEINFDTAEWRIPSEKMKMESPHIVPLAKQALEIFQQLYPITGKGKCVFPGMRGMNRPISDNTINAALRTLGYDTSKEITGHGFRSMASTLLNEQGKWRPDVIERQLAHMERNGVRAAYNYAEYLPQRRKMMQAWADYLDKLKKEAKKKI